MQKWTPSWYQAVVLASVIALGYGAAEPQMPKRKELSETTVFF